MVKTPQTVEDWLACISLPECLAMTPSGHLCTVFGAELWIDGLGVQYSRDAYIATYGVDPVIGWQAVKEYRKCAGKNDKMVML